MNPWRKRRRQKLRRQNENFYAYIEWLNVVDIATVTVGPLTPEQRAMRMTPLVTVNLEGAFWSQFVDESAAAIGENEADLVARFFDFTKPMPRLFIAHDPSEFYGLEDVAS